MSLRIIVAAAEQPPFGVDAVVVEDDTYFVLGEETGFREPAEHPIRIWTAVHDAEPARPGSVSVRGGRPLRLAAVVHDLSADPTWKEEWIALALAEVLREVEARGLAGLGLPILGGVHGRISPQRFVALLNAALDRNPPSALERIWLIAPQDRLDDVKRLIGEDRAPNQST